MNRSRLHPLVLPVLLSLALIQGCAAPQHRYPAQPRQRPVPAQQPRVQTQPTIPEAEVVPQPSVQQGTNPAVGDISRQARQLTSSGQLEAAAQAVERGLRIAPKDAALWSQLAEIRLEQGRFGQARSLAAKSNSLAGGDSALIRKNQLIIGRALRNGR